MTPPEGFTPCRAGDVQPGWQLWMSIGGPHYRVTVISVTPTAAGVMIGHTKGHSEMGVDEPLHGKAPTP